MYFLSRAKKPPQAFSSAPSRPISPAAVITSNGGVTLLRRADERLGLTRRVAACFTDHRRPELVAHDVETVVLQRFYGLALAYEDLNDHEDLRRDPALQAVAGRTTPRRGDCAPLAGKSTLNRLELAAAGRNDEKARKIVVNTEPDGPVAGGICVWRVMSRSLRRLCWIWTPPTSRSTGSRRNASSTGITASSIATCRCCS